MPTPDENLADRLTAAAAAEMAAMHLSNQVHAGPDLSDADVLAGLSGAPGDSRLRLRDALHQWESAVLAGDELVRWLGYETDGGPLVPPSPCYHRCVWELITALTAAGAVPLFGWMRWDGPSRYRTAADVVAAPLPDALRLLTVFVRGERFGDGVLAAAIADGRLLTAAHRALAGT